ncbi:MAG: hypothetical protein ACI8TQ_003235 [Planctomycetota bacterium]|jgi:hypothetical protein
MSSLPNALLTLALIGSPSVGQGSAEPESTAGRYVRLLESEKDSILKLQIAVRSFKKEGAPEIQLAGAMHIGEPSFYKQLQERLDALDLVLFESVKPPGAGRPEHDLSPPDDPMRVLITRGRIRFMAGAVMQYRELKGTLPHHLGAVAAELPADIRSLVAIARKDAWGRPFKLAAAPAQTQRQFDIQSLGADGLIGGEKFNADLCFSDQDDLSDSERGKRGGLQADLADALGLVFQLEAMNHAGANWRNSDLSIDQVEARMANSGVAGDALFDSLSGESFLAKAGGYVIKLMGSFNYGSAVMKLVGVETLSRADQLIAQVPGEMKDMFEVLLISRNDAVIGDLKAAIADSNGYQTIGVIYGAAHMANLEERITGEMGYQISGETWLSAVTLDLDNLGIPPTQARFIRKAIKNAIDKQLGGW